MPSGRWDLDRLTASLPSARITPLKDQRMSQQASRLEIIAITPASFTASRGHVALPAAASKAGAIGCLDLEYVDNSQSLNELAHSLKAACSGLYGIKCSISQLPAVESILPVISVPGASLPNLVILSLNTADNQPLEQLQQSVALIHQYQLRAFVESVSPEEAILAERAGADAVIVKGNEAGGRVGDETTFVLLQTCSANVKIPLWAHGGIGLHTAAACRVAGAAGVVLDAQLLLTRESPLAPALRSRVAQMDGTETVCLGDRLGDTYRFFVRPGSQTLETISSSLHTLCSELETAGVQQARLHWRSLISSQISAGLTSNTLDQGIWPLGQDVAFAARLAGQYTSVAGILKALWQSVDEHLQQAQKAQILSAGSALAQAHSTGYPIVQGAMARVSDSPEFAYNVAQAGALPLLALSLMRRDEARQLLSATKERLQDLPWGVGILGFVPSQLRSEQLEAIASYKPQFAIIAGGRPDQAKALEDMGIQSYLHIPSPLLLQSFMEAGSRRFVFEGKECGGHVGPRSSFILWEEMIALILSSLKPGEDASSFHILFAGGIHDRLSAAMVSAMAAPLAARGARIGLLMGTAYIFTQEAVSSGAIVSKFQEAALNCNRTVLFESGPGHSIRCIDSPYRQAFDSRRRKLEQDGKSRNEIREDLESMNLGRLRIASKGTARPATNSDDHASSGLVCVPQEQQWAEGMYMIGQVATLHHNVISLQELHRDVSESATELINQMQSQEKLPAQAARQHEEDIAIIGMSCLFPQAGDLESYWHNIINKVDAITEVPADHWDWHKLFDPDRLTRDKSYSKWGGFLQDTAFDPASWGIPPASMPYIDPMQLLLLDVTRAAIADAGYSPPDLPKQRTSVVLANAGHGPITADYLLRSMLDWKLSDLPEETKEQIRSSLPEWTEDSFPGLLGNVAAGRIANRFDFGGINFSVDAACASSLAALYVGMADLRRGNSDIMLLTAVDTHNQPIDYLSFSKTQALSPRGHCKTFDATADGIVISEGIAALVLKRLSDAERDGDRIYAVIKGIGGSSDGRDLSLTAPRKAGQISAINRAYADAGLSPRTVELIEAHGTGTIAGDKTEIEALRQVWETSGAATGSCALGSVKTMIGHTKAAAGLASLIKTAKALYHKVLPPTIGVEQPNPACQSGQGPLYLNTETRPWFNSTDNMQLPRRAGVSAFGFGGTNFHAVLEEYTSAQGQPPATRWPAELFLFSAASPEELQRSFTTLDRQAQECLESSDSISMKTPLQSEKEKQSLASLSLRHYLRYNSSSHRASTPCSNTADETSGEPIKAAGAESADMQPDVGNKDLATNTISSQEELRCAIVASCLADLRDKLQRATAALSSPEQSNFIDPKGIYLSGQSSRPDSKIAFLFPGQGSQRVNMLSDLALNFSEIRDSIAIADQILQNKLPNTLSRFIYPLPEVGTKQPGKQQEELNNTHIAQPAMAAADLGVWRLLSTLAVTPDMVAGHSFGEYVALCTAGAMSTEQLISIAEQRGRILAESNTAEPGAMAAVSASPHAVNQLLSKLAGVQIANVNSPKQCIIAGERDAVGTAIKSLTEQGLPCRAIAVSAAFHSPLMEPAQGQLLKALLEVPFKQPSLPVYSNTDAKQYTESADKIAAKLVTHLVSPVDFAAEIETMYEHGARTFVEVGPGNILTGLVDTILADKPHLAVSVDRNGRPGVVQLVHALGQLFSGGVRLDIGRLFANRFNHATELALLARGNDKMLAGKSSSRKGRVYLINSSGIRQPDKQSASGTATTGGLSRQQATGSVTMSEDKAKLALTGKSEQAMPRPNPATSLAAPAQHSKQSATSLATNPAVQSGHNSANTPSARQAPLVSTLQPAAHTPNSAPQSISQVDLVMLEFQKSMLQMTNSFLETQQRVMLAYLQSGALPASTAKTDLSSDLAALNAPQLWQPGTSSSPTDFAGLDSNGNSSLQPQSIYTDPPEIQPAREVSQQSAVESDSVSIVQAECVASLTPDFLISSLIDIVSQRTGYPQDMLDPALDLEADLGVDSIKRIEILSGFRKLLPENKQIEIEDSIEKLAGLKTLQGIMDWITSEFGSDKDVPTATTNTTGTATGMPAHTPGVAPAEKCLDTQAAPSLQAQVNVIARGLVTTVQLAPAPATQFSCPGPVLIVDDETGVGTALAEALKLRGQTVVLVRHREPGSSSADQTYCANLADEQCVTDLLAQVRSTHGSIAGLIHLLSLQMAAVPINTKSLFLLTKALEPDFQSHSSTSATKAVKPALFAATALGGTFGAGPAGASALTISATIAQPGIAGIIKSVAKEWTQTFCRVVDFEPGANPTQISRWILSELDSPDSLVEVGYANDCRTTLDITAASLPADTDSQPTTARINIDSSSVILVTGGARGITAQICQELAQHGKPTLIIVGKQPRPQEESQSTSGLNTPRELKAALIEQMRSEGKTVSVSQVEPAYQKLIREREIRSNLAKLNELGAQVYYYALDVRDEQAFGELIDRIYDIYGRLDGVIHGAGIIEDALIKDKTWSSFERVFDTKVKSTLVLRNKVQLKSLKFLFLFSSVVGRTGNAGQADYVAANEVMNKMALEFDRHTPARVASLMWGPWAGGMAPPELESVFASHGWAMIQPAIGRSAFMHELKFGKKGEVEVLLVGKPAQSTETPVASGSRMHQSTPSVEGPGHWAFHVVLDPKVDLYLNDHKFDSIPVMPMAVALELMAEAAQSVCPALHLSSVHSLEIPAGIVFDAGSKSIVVTIAQQSQTAEKTVLQASLCTGSERRRTHFKATLELSRDWPATVATAAPPLAGIPLTGTGATPLDQAETTVPTASTIYRDWLFHGPIFQGIETVEAMGTNGIIGTVSTSNPAQCLQTPGSQGWIIDPILLDSSMQLAGVWSRHYLDITVIPTGFRSLHRLRPTTCKHLIARVFIPPELHNNELQCDLSVCEPDGTVILVIEGLGGIGSKALNRLSAQGELTGATR